jgi:hypothetical protein
VAVSSRPTAELRPIRFAVAKGTIKRRS